MGAKGNSVFNREKSLRFWLAESPSYNFSVSISTSLAQPLGIRALGMDIAMLGILTAIQMGSVGVGAILGIILVMKYRYYRKKLWLLLGAINRIGWACLIFATLIPKDLGLEVFYLIVAVSQISGAIAGIAAGDVGGDLVSREKAADFFGRLNSLNNAAALVSLLISISVFLILGSGSYEAYLILYLSSLASAILSTYFLTLIGDDPRSIEAFREKAGTSSARSALAIYRKTYDEIIASSYSREYILILMSYTIAVNIPASLWNYYLIYNIGGDEIWITSKTATTYLVKSLALRIWPFIINRYGVRIVLSIALMLISPIPIIFIFSRTFASQIALEVYSAIWWASWDLSTGLYNLYLFPREARPVALSIITLTTNVGASAASIMGSMISLSIPNGSEATFILSSILRGLIAYAGLRKLPRLGLGV